MSKHDSANRERHIDIIKGIAMVMVILVHANQSFDPYIEFFNFFQMGCQMFFVASGFCAAMSFSKKLAKKGFVSATKSFWRKRFESIAPAWYLMMLITYIINSVLISWNGHPMIFGTNREPMSILCNLLFIHGLIPSCNNNVMPGGWYVGTTMLLYFLTPLVVYIMLKLDANGKRTFVLFSSVISVGSLIEISILLPQMCFLYNKNT